MRELNQSHELALKANDAITLLTFLLKNPNLHTGSPFCNLKLSVDLNKKTLLIKHVSGALFQVYTKDTDEYFVSSEQPTPICLSAQQINAMALYYRFGFNQGEILQFKGKPDQIYVLFPSHKLFQSACDKVAQYNLAPNTDYRISGYKNKQGQKLAIELLSPLKNVFGLSIDKTTKDDVTTSTIKRTYSHPKIKPKNTKTLVADVSSHLIKRIINQFTQTPQNLTLLLECVRILPMDILQPILTHLFVNEFNGRLSQKHPLITNVNETLHRAFQLQEKVLRDFRNRLSGPIKIMNYTEDLRIQQITGNLFELYSEIAGYGGFTSADPDGRLKSIYLTREKFNEIIKNSPEGKRIATAIVKYFSLGLYKGKVLTSRPTNKSIYIQFDKASDAQKCVDALLVNGYSKENHFTGLRTIKNAIEIKGHLKTELGLFVVRKTHQLYAQYFLPHCPVDSLKDTALTSLISQIRRSLPKYDLLVQCITTLRKELWQEILSILVVNQFFQFQNSAQSFVNYLESQLSLPTTQEECVDAAALMTGLPSLEAQTQMPEDATPEKLTVTQTNADQTRTTPSGITTSNIFSPPQNQNENTADLDHSSTPGLSAD